MTGNAARIWNYGSAPWHCTKPKFLVFIRLGWHELYMNSNEVQLWVQHFSKNIPALLSDRNSFLYVSLSGFFIAGCMNVSYFAYIQIVANDRNHFFGLCLKPIPHLERIVIFKPTNPNSTKKFLRANSLKTDIRLYSLKFRYQAWVWSQTTYRSSLLLWSYEMSLFLLNKGKTKLNKSCPWGK